MSDHASSPFAPGSSATQSVHQSTAHTASSGPKPATRLLRCGPSRSPFGETAEALYLTSGFVYESAEEASARFAGEADGYMYSRYDNPTVDMFEQRIALLEGAEKGSATASGMAAMTASLLCHLRMGDHVVAARALFGSCRVVIEQLLPRFGITHTLVDGTDLDAWRAAVRPETRVFFLETPSNPTLEIIDLAAVAEIAHAAGSRLIVDNVFATPILQRPMTFGADIVFYSATKHIDGQGRCLGGVVLSSEDFYQEHLQPFLRNTGPSMSPFNAWVLAKGLETLSLRVERQCEHAARVADGLEALPGVTRVLYPGRADHPQHALAARQMRAGGTLVAFEVDGGTEAAFRMVNRLQIIDISNNLGDTKSLVTHPATTTHRKLSQSDRDALGIFDGVLRLSVGLEDPQDLIDDLAQALHASRS